MVRSDINNKPIPETIAELLDLPMLPFEDRQYHHRASHPVQHRVLVGCCGTSSNWPGCSIKYQNQQVDCYNKAIMGNIVSILENSNGYLIDNKNEIMVNLLEGSLFSTKWQRIFEDDEYENLALVGDEIIRFQKADLIQSYQYKLSGLLRGLYGSKIKTHEIGARFVLLDEGLARIDISPMSKIISLEIGTIGQNDMQIEKTRKLIQIPVTHKSSQTLPPTGICLEYNELHEPQLRWLNIDLDNDQLFEDITHPNGGAMITMVTVFDEHGGVTNSEICHECHTSGVLAPNWNYAILTNKKGNSVSEQAMPIQSSEVKIKSMK